MVHLTGVPFIQRFSEHSQHQGREMISCSAYGQPVNSLLQKVISNTSIAAGF